MNFLQKKSLKYFFCFSQTSVNCFPKFKMVDKSSEKTASQTFLQSKDFWEIFSCPYTEIFEDSSQPILSSLLSMLKISKSSKILEESCGGGKSLALVLSMKSTECEYCVSDFSENMLVLASKRMEYIENDIVGNMQFWDKSCFDPNVKKTWQKDFPKSKTYLRLLDNENLLGIEKETFDIVFSNLSLHLVSNPEKMLSEAFRVVKKGGQVGFSVVGRPEKSKFLTIVPMVLKKYGLELPNERSNFHLSYRTKLMQMMTEAGFKNVWCWYQFFPFNYDTEEEYMKIVDSKMNKTLIDSISDEGKRKEARKEILDEFMKPIKDCEPVGVEALIVIGKKN